MISKSFKRILMESKNYNKPNILKIDGSMLEGGGQLFRMSIAMSYLFK